ncbi:kinase-like domain-containing protein [Cantharellus anzutake]|uniref:kinase-like domain-containing protein n=1 Tax=Cantharellus anzutake TaxID=1750568 RepID=UPI001905F333|nr:kinase-like domain-containing protein [Cantharellus anzutake]KAF8329779.1 kinase-like domain-containing protein [Cantharellus anzutake]
MPTLEFDIIPFEDIKGKWKKLGSGSFGNVYKGTYLGIDVAIKEVLPSNEYDVSKYFDREWRIMKEARHPNVVLYIALSRAPPPDNRIFIISEFIENGSYPFIYQWRISALTPHLGNLRQYIWDKAKPFPWKLRLSFATDIVRAMAYLHARQCIHRDLKPENLLITANGRIKVTDFGFARIVEQTEVEARKLTFCGTDAYMSPEIQQSEKFGLDTDVFSLGIIFCEILARKLADEQTFCRTAPDFAIDPHEVRSRASPDTPPAFLDLALACCATNRKKRPTMAQVLTRLGEIEVELLSRGTTVEEPHIGSIKFLLAPEKKSPFLNRATKRPHIDRRIPSFGMGIHVGRKPETGPAVETKVPESVRAEDPSEDEEDAELEAILAQNGVALQSTVDDSGSDMSWRLTGWMAEYADRQAPNPSAPPVNEITQQDLSDSVESIIAHAPLLPAHGPINESTISSSHYSSEGSSIMTVRPQALSATQQPAPKNHHPREPNTAPTPEPFLDDKTSYFTAGTPSLLPDSQCDQMEIDILPDSAPAPISTGKEATTPIDHQTKDAPNSGGPPRLHRFSLVKSGKKADSISAIGSRSHAVVAGHSHSLWSPFDLIFGKGMCGRCDLCGKRLGWKPVLECDDCGLKVHMKCGEVAPMDCQEREVALRTRALQTPPPKSPKPHKSPKSNPPSPKKKEAKNK